MVKLILKVIGDEVRSLIQERKAAHGNDAVQNKITERLNELYKEQEFWFKYKALQEGRL